MTSGLPNDEKSRVRQQYATGEVGRDALMAAEMASYHGPGTCTFYGTANTNQMLMEFMGLHLPGASFVTPGTPLREALTVAGIERATQITALGNDYSPAGHILDEKAFVNGIVGLMATGGSTNLILHLPAMARAAGILIDLDDFSAISGAVPLMAKVYPNGLADVNHFHAAGGLSYMIGQLLDAGLLHEDVTTVAGDGLALYAREPKLKDGKLVWEDGPTASLNDRILRPANDAFQPSGGLKDLKGNLGRGVIKISAVAPDRHVIEAPARIFENPGRSERSLQTRRIHPGHGRCRPLPGAPRERNAGTPLAHPHPRRPAGPGPESGPRHRWTHVGRLRQGPRRDPCQPRSRLRRPARLSA